MALLDVGFDFLVDIFGCHFRILAKSFQRTKISQVEQALLELNERYFILTSPLHSCHCRLDLALGLEVTDSKFTSASDVLIGWALALIRYPGETAFLR